MSGRGPGNARPARVLFIGPYPPPFAGPEMGMKLFLESSCLRQAFDIAFLCTNVRKTNVDKGRLDLRMLTAFFRFFSKLLWMLLRHRPKLVYYPVTATQRGWVGRDCLCLFLCRLWRARIVIHLRAGHLRLNFRRFHPWSRILVRRACRGVSMAIVQADALRPQFEGLVPPGRVEVLYQAIEAGEYDNDALDAYQRGKILFIGHLTAAKGYCDLLRAFGPVCERFEEARLYCAGTIRRGESNVLFDQTTGEPLRYEDPFQAEQRFLAGPWAGRYHRLGLIDGEEKLGHLRSSDIFVLPSYSEGFSRALLEAMSVGKPVVFTPVGAHQEVLRDGREGIEVQPGDVEALTQAVCRLLAERGLRDRIAANNYRKVRRRFDIDRIASRLAGLLERALAG